MSHHPRLPVMSPARLRARRSGAISLAWLLLGGCLVIPTAVRGTPCDTYGEITHYVSSVVPASPLDIRSLELDGDMLYAANAEWGTGIYTLDVSDPAATHVIGGKLVNSGSPVFDVAGTGNVLCATSVGRLFVLDRSDPAHLLQLASLDLPGNTALQISISGSLAFVTCFNDGLAIVDISNPLTPVLVKQVVIPGARGVAAAGTSVLVASETAGLVCVDASVPAAAHGVGSLSMHAVSVALSGPYAFVGTLSTYSGLHVVDISNPTAPVQVAYLGGFDGYAVDILGQTAWVQEHVIDISTPTNPVWKMDVDVFPGAGTGGSVMAQDGFAWFAAGSGGVQVVQLGGLEPPAALGAYTFESYDTPLMGVAGSTLFTHGVTYLGSQWVGQLRCVDMTNPGTPQLLGSVNYVIPGFPSIASLCLALEPERVVILGEMRGSSADGQARLSFLDVSDPVLPTFLSAVVLPRSHGSGAYFRLAVRGNYAYLTSDVGLHIVDITNLAAVHEVGFVPVGYENNDVCLDGDLGYVAFGGDPTSGLAVIDVADPVHPLLLGEVSLPESGAAVAVRGHYALVNTRGNSSSILCVVDVHQPATPQLVREVQVSSTILNAGEGRIALDDSHAYLAQGIAGVPIVDISDPAQATLIGNLPISLGNSDVFASGGRLYSGPLHEPGTIAGMGVRVWAPECSAISAVTPEPLPVTPPLMVYPNPFRESTFARVSLSRPDRVTLDLYDVAGRRLRRLVDRAFQAGEWRVPINADVPDGVYFLRMESQGMHRDAKLIKRR